MAVALGVYNSGASDISISQPLRGDRDNMGRSLTTSEFAQSLNLSLGTLWNWLPLASVPDTESEPLTNPPNIAADETIASSVLNRQGNLIWYGMQQITRYILKISMFHKTKQLSLG
ncbi:hypothetical protein H4N54_07175 [Limnospira fusiformis KN01]|uniref:hypothetical protein n=1 Tax=Limnospira fusiformis TaxID=54297 RepID=UPI001658AA92|nr:hypothetical protein [Limnospira fusiformis]ULB47111.1 hypothetical protein H4N54_07175 [Limnospira fusiformis KN01]